MVRTVGYNWGGAFYNGGDGGTAIASKSGIAVTVNIHNTIAGGGGGGSMELSTLQKTYSPLHGAGGSGGAPYGLPGYIGREKYGAVGDLLVVEQELLKVKLLVIKMGISI